jgi:2-polyprenyl-6-methoxyphenol hydroxylase-like FAD-dependent oxidoreductase
MYDVAIAGAGPVGLFLACELRLARLSVLVLERADDPDSPLKRLPFGMRGLSVPTLEGFYRRGLLDDIAAAMRSPDHSVQDTSTPKMIAAAQQPRRQAGHFAGIPFEYSNIDSAKWTYRLPNPADTNMAADMARIETVLAARAGALGVDIMRGLEVDDFEQSDDGIVVRAGGRSFCASWLVGCDGGRSVVRKKGGFDFVGTNPSFTGYSVQVDLAGRETLPMGRHYTPTGMYFQSGPGTIAMVDFDGGAFHRSAPVTLQHVQDVLQRIVGVDITLSALHLGTTWTDRAEQATTYRNGRVLLAGDAAHIHSPLGGQGLNLGLGDAMNLGWKLGAIIKHGAPRALLDSYSKERHPIGAAVLDWSRAQVALMEPNRKSRALESIIRDLIDTRDGATYFAEQVWGVSFCYDLGGQHPLIGRSAPDFELADGTRLGILLRNGISVLLNFDCDAALRSIASRLGDELAYSEGEPTNALGLSAALIRPDGIVAWASDGAPDSREVIQVLSQWLSSNTAAHLG